MNNLFPDVLAIKRALPKGKTFALVGGCFDLLHVGHIHLLEYAASLGDILVVAVLSDEYAHAYKGSFRPVINQQQRATMVASVRFADFVYVSDVSPSSPDTLQLLQPDYVVFGEESRTTEKMRRRMEALTSFSPATQIRFLPRYDEEIVSTSSIIEKIRSVTS